jgi:hypothetical protein
MWDAAWRKEELDAGRDKGRKQGLSIVTAQTISGQAQP